jgi:hypothetical protein
VLQVYAVEAGGLKPVSADRVKLSDAYWIDVYEGRTGRNLRAADARRHQKRQARVNCLVRHRDDFAYTQIRVP